MAPADVASADAMGATGRSGAGDRLHDLGLLSWRADCQEGNSCESAPVVLVAVVVVIVVLTVLLLILVAAARKLLVREGPILHHRCLILALCVAVLGATPVGAGWDDGCNSHSGLFAAIDVPRIALTEPQGFVLGYYHNSTLVGCP